MIYHPSQPQSRVLGVRNGDKSRLLWQASALRRKAVLYLARLLITGEGAYTTTRKPFCSSAASNRERWARELLEQQQQQAGAASPQHQSSSSQALESATPLVPSRTTEEGFGVVEERQCVAAGYEQLQLRLSFLIPARELDDRYKEMLPGLAPALQQGRFKYLLLPFHDSLTGLNKVGRQACSSCVAIVCW